MTDGKSSADTIHSAVAHFAVAHFAVARPQRALLQTLAGAAVGGGQCTHLSCLLTYDTRYKVFCPQSGDQNRTTYTREMDGTPFVQI